MGKLNAGHVRHTDIRKQNVRLKIDGNFKRLYSVGGSLDMGNPQIAPLNIV